MEFILDTADVQEIKNLNELLTVAGVTTNPTIITKSGKDFQTTVKEIIEVLDEEQTFFIQAISATCEEIVEEAKYIDSLREKNIYVKIPVTHEGLKAIKECKKLGIGVLATAIYTADQAFMAAMNGADYLAPYVNRMENYGDGIKEVKDLIEMLRVNGLNSKVVAASFKNKKQVHELIVAGIQAVTVPVDVAYAMINHPGTEIAVGEFTENWNKAFGRRALV
ncbi:MAG: fructose-6-phosphate aldolase [Lachnospiraceae bacterium]|nr:fructose-6-phosphate aldolase [Lachnospiraceae bacterium]